ncbi:NTP transferase domain-containing protein [Candidatus Palauibacter sp.]|uniref:NTP transferase domain-containing protein n=1 Tax=Candidatus Palauibacter sp. TaxID=3101350 RepID=UPI003AF2FB2A
MSRTRPRLLFVCVENSCRSQMAEAFARMLAGDRVEAASGGSRPSGVVNARAIEIMSELGYDLRAHRSRGLDELSAGAFDAVVTMGCGDACPHVPARRREDWAIRDPKDLPLDEFRAVRDEVGRRVSDLLLGLGVKPPACGRGAARGRGVHRRVTTATRSLVIVAGGRARRLGRDKPLVEIGGRAILLRILDATSHIADVVLAVRDVPPFQSALAADGWEPRAESADRRPGSVALRDPSGRELVVVPDPVSDLGPLAGLASGLDAARGAICVVLAGDLPFVAPDLVDRLCRELAGDGGLDAVVPRARGRAQPLCAAYRREVGQLATRLFEGTAARCDSAPSMMKFLEQLRVRFVTTEQLAGIGDLEAMVRGVDSPEDLAWAVRCAARAG